MKKYIIPFVFALVGSIFGVFIFLTFLAPDFIEETPVSEQAKYVYYDKPAYINPEFSFAGPYNPVDFTLAASMSTPTVVNIKSSSKVRSGYWIGSSEDVMSTGSGVLVSNDGYIVTNNHVIEDGIKFEVSLFDNREYKAELIGRDVSTDLALLKIEEEDLPYSSFGNSDSLQVGAWVIAVGNPFSLESTVTAGIVSAKGRNIDILDGEYSIESFIQTDAVVNPGNSGGALVNTKGELIGINTAIITKSGKYEGYSFAVPSNLVRKVISDLKDFGFVQRGLLGITIEDINSDLAKKLRLKKIQGVHVARVSPSSGAEDAGLSRGDVIIGINGKEIKTLPELQEVVATFSLGDIIEIEYLRNNRRMLAKVTLKDSIHKGLTLNDISSEEMKSLGFEIRDMSQEEVDRYGTDGLIVPFVIRNSRADQVQLSPDYLITHLNKERIYSKVEFLAKLKANEGTIMLDGFYPGFEGDFRYTIIR